MGFLRQKHTAVFYTGTMAPWVRVGLTTGRAIRIAREVQVGFLVSGHKPVQKQQGFSAQRAAKIKTLGFGVSKFFKHDLEVPGVSDQRLR